MAFSRTMRVEAVRKRTVVTMVARRMRGVGFGAIALAGAIGAANVASAATLQQNFVFGPTQSGLYFDSNLGALNSVTFSYNYNDVGSYSVTSNDPTTVYANSSYTSVTSFNSVPMFARFANTGLYATPLIYDTYAPGQTITHSVDSGPISGSVTATSSLDLAGFTQQGGGIFSFPPTIVGRVGGQISSGTEGFKNVPTTRADVISSGAFSLTYNYTAAVHGAVPEPATWGMMIVGFGAVGGTLRRRRKGSTRVTFRLTSDSAHVRPSP